jgi:hypothetical protein
MMTSQKFFLNLEMRSLKILFCFGLVILFSGCVGQTEMENKTDVSKHHNKLDDFDTAKEIQKLLAVIDTDYSDFKVDTMLQYKNEYGRGDDSVSHSLAKRLKVKPWVKADFDNNGYTDVLVVGNWYGHSVLVILDSGENRFYIKMITRRSFQEPTYPVLTMIGSNSVIFDYTRKRYTSAQAETELETDTLIFRYGNFVEYHNIPAQHKIEKIEYETGFCFGSCPVFSMKITSDRKAIYEGNNYNFPDGKYRGIVDSAHYNMLTSLLNYIHFTELDSGYFVTWSDDQDCTLIITYDGGKIKKIDDYGLLGTYGLNRIYSILFDMRDDQKWIDKRGKIKVPEKKIRQQF